MYAYTQGAAVYVKDVEVLGQMSVYTEAQLKINSDSITQEVKRAKGIEDELRASIKVNAENITTFTGTLPVVLEIHKTDNNGGIGWTYGNVYIKNGLITSIPQ